jgi:hypothetical protein
LIGRLDTKAAGSTAMATRIAQRLSFGKRRAG